MSKMAPTKSGPTNFRSYEAQARLLAAVIATCKPKLDYKAIAKHIGSDATPSSVDHRLRPLKHLAKLQAQCLEEGKDPMNLPVEKAEIQKLFGESTAGGLEFHFREVKATGKAQQEFVKAGRDPTEVPIGPQTRVGKGRTQKSAPSTPASSRKRTANTKTSAATTGGRARKQQRLENGHVDIDDSDTNSVDADYDELDLNTTPSKSRSEVPKNPAYTVNNSTTNSEADSPLPTPVPYAQVQAERQARARAEFQAEALRGRSHNDYNAEDATLPGTHSDNQQTQHQDVFKSAPATHDSDDIMEINANQFTGGKPSGYHANVDASKVIKNDPFESDASQASGFVDLTSVHHVSEIFAKTRGNVPSSSYQDHQSNYDWSSYAHDDDISLGDGEV